MKESFCPIFSEEGNLGIPVSLNVLPEHPLLFVPAGLEIVTARRLKVGCLAVTEFERNSEAEQRMGNDGTSTAETAVVSHWWSLLVQNARLNRITNFSAL